METYYEIMGDYEKQDEALLICTKKIDTHISLCNCDVVSDKAKNMLASLESITNTTPTGEGIVVNFFLAIWNAIVSILGFILKTITRFLNWIFGKKEQAEKDLESINDRIGRLKKVDVRTAVTTLSRAITVFGKNVDIIDTGSTISMISVNDTSIETVIAIDSKVKEAIERITNLLKATDLDTINNKDGEKLSSDINVEVVSAMSSIKDILSKGNLAIKLDKPVTTRTLPKGERPTSEIKFYLGGNKGLAMTYVGKIAYGVNTVDIPVKHLSSVAKSATLDYDSMVTLSNDIAASRKQLEIHKGKDDVTDMVELFIKNMEKMGSDVKDNEHLSREVANKIKSGLNETVKVLRLTIGVYMKVVTVHENNLNDLTNVILSGSVDTLEKDKLKAKND